MTNKEAIEELKAKVNLAKELEDEDVNFISIDALALAIKVLEERPQGEWIGDTDYESFQGHYEAYKCNKCGYGLHWRGYYTNEYNFCPNCGADMRGE